MDSFINRTNSFPGPKGKVVSWPMPKFTFKLTFVPLKYRDKRFGVSSQPIGKIKDFFY